MNCTSKRLRCCVSPPICQALSGYAFGQSDSTLSVIQSSLGPYAINLFAPFTMVVAKVELGDVALQVMRTDAVKCADDSTLQNGEVAFDRIGVDIAADIFACFVVDRFMTGYQWCEGSQWAIAIGHKAGFGVQLLADIRLEVCSADARDRGRRAHLAAAFDQRENHRLADAADVRGLALAAMLVALFAAYVGRIGLYWTAVAHNAARSLHRFADTVRHKPRRLVRHAKHTLKLLAANALLAGAHQVHSLKPYIQLDLAALKHRADRYRELLATVLALVKASAMRVAFELVMVLRNGSAVRANRSIRPANVFKPFAGFGFVFEFGLVQNRFGHDCFPYLWRHYACLRWVCQPYNSPQGSCVIADIRLKGILKMIVIRLDIGDGRGIIECAVASHAEAERLRKFTIDMEPAMIDAERWREVEQLMVYERFGGRAAWTIDDGNLQGDSATDAIDAAIERRRAALDDRAKDDRRE